MANLQNQVHMYSIDTNYFMTKKERKIFDEIQFLRLCKKGKTLKKELLENYKDNYSEEVEKCNQIIKLKEVRKNYVSVGASKKEHELYKEYIKNRNEINTATEELKNIIDNKVISELNKKLNNELEKNEKIQRKITCELKIRDKISMFESNLTRTLGIKTNKETESIIVIRVLHYPIFKNIALNGFKYKSKKYVMFSASAGMIRNKKVMFIKEDVLKAKQNTIFCGLTLDKINEYEERKIINDVEVTETGINLNKYLAYTSLVATASEKYKYFKIDKSIVVEDFKTTINELVDYIDYENLDEEELWTVKRQPMDIEIQAFDGAGICTDYTGQIRLPFIKGLMIKFDIPKFVKQARKKEKDDARKNGIKITKTQIGKVIDIYGKEYDILEDGIKYIFTKSQFKMWKYYDSWDDYKEKFKKYNCECSKVNEEEIKNENARISYQPLQTLYDLSDDELLELLKETNDTIENIAENRQKMLEVMGATKENTNKDYFQKALMLYPQLLNDIYCKEVIKDIKKSLINDARQGKFKIDKSRYGFILPDPVCFAEWLLCHDEQPKGLLKKGEVSCIQFEKGEELSLSRSPHLNFSHCINTNVLNDDTNKWFKAKGVYVSCYSIDSEILKNDYDGDEALIMNNKTIISSAKRIIKERDIVPLSYNMEKGNLNKVNAENLYNAMIESYKGGKIGLVSNSLTKLWNCGNITDDVIKAINFLAVDANIEVDYAKTLWKPYKSKNMNSFLRQYTNAKLPHFFMYIRDKHKKEKQVEEINNSTVNKLLELVCNNRVRFGAKNLGKFDYKNLLSNKQKDIDTSTVTAQSIINKFKELNQTKKFNTKEDTEEKNNYVYYHIKNEMLNIFKDEKYIVDVLVEYFFNKEETKNKRTLFNTYGKIIYENIRKNINPKVKICENCGVEIIKTNNRIKYCSVCAEEINREKTRNNKKSIAV